MSAEQPEWADDVDDDEAPLADIETEDTDDDVDDVELEAVALNTPVDLTIEGIQGDSR